MAVLFHISNYIGFNLDQPDMMKWNTMHAQHTKCHSFFSFFPRGNNGKKLKLSHKKTNSINESHTCSSGVLRPLYLHLREEKKNQNKFKCLSTNRRCHCFSVYPFDSLCILKSSKNVQHICNQIIIQGARWFTKWKTT